MHNTFLARFTGRSFTWAFFLLIFLVISGCSKDDDEISEPQDPFYKDALASATIQQLTGIWAIHEVAFEGQSANVPVNYEECGRDFFQFTSSNVYKDYFYVSSYECEKQVQDLNYDLEKGVITLRNDWGSSEEMVITQLTGDKLVFKMKVEIDEDPELEIVSFLARKHTPPNDLDLYSYTFGFELTDENRNEIKYTWQAYDGFYKFDRYEIYRSAAGCSKTNAQLVATIKDRAQTSFIDLDPPASQEICYYFKVFTEKGLLGESELVQFFTDNLRPSEVNFVNAEVQNAEVKLEWEPFEGNYFSHYKIAVRNYDSGSGYAFQEYPVGIIENREVTSFTDQTPPHLKEPVYAIYAYDIFGNVSSEAYSNKNKWKLNWSHPEVMNLDNIKFATPAVNASEIFFYGRSAAGQSQLIKYNYQNHEVAAIANKQPEAMTSIHMQVHNSETGNELFFAQGNALAVYDASNLSYKYELKPEGMPFFFDSAYLGNGIFSFTNSTDIYTFKRTNGNMELISQKSHFTQHLGSTAYHLLPLKNGEILVGHYQEPKSYKFSIDAQGKISDGQLVDIPVTSRSQKTSLYSPNQDYVINFLENKLFSTLTFNFQESFEIPYFPSGISRDGNLILGSNNDPQENISNESIHEKKARIYNLTTNKVTTVETQGYPHLIFENHQGQIISVSSGFKRENLEITAPKPDIFVEILDF
jgi:hypothetical protein